MSTFMEPHSAKTCALTSNVAYRSDGTTTGDGAIRRALHTYEKHHA